MLIVQRYNRTPGKWLAGQQLASRMHLRARLVVHDDQFCFVQVEHLAKLLSDLKLVVPVPRGEGLLVSNPNKFFRIGLEIAALRNGQAERRCSQNIGDKPKTLPIPRIQVWTGAFLNRQFRGEERLLAIESHLGGALGPVEPMHQERIQLLIFPHPHLHRQALHRPDQAQSARFDLDLAADSAGVGTVPNQSHLDLRIGVATLIAQVTQAPVRQGNNHIRIAVPVKISEVDFRHRAAIEFIKAELGCLFLESGKTEIAPHSDFFSNRPEVQPSIIIVIDCYNLADTRISRKCDFLSLSAIEADADFPITHHRQVRPQVVIEIAGAKNGACDPIGRLAGNQPSAALFFQQQRRPLLPASDHIRDPVPVPIFHHYRMGVVKRGRDPGSAGDICEKQRAELAIDPHLIAIPCHCYQIQFPREIQVHQRSVNRAQSAQAAQRRDIHRQSIRPEFE